MIRQQRLRVELPVMLAIGSNLGDREATLRDAVHAINAIEGVTVDAASSIVQTPALKLSGIDHSAPAYLNAVVSARSALEPHALLAELQRIEADNGRVRDERWGDRTLDIDIISFAHLQVDDELLTIPHPRAAERSFVLVPLLQLNPHATLAGVGDAVVALAGIENDATEFEAEPLW
ncbi:2-amino-4-hydroxy-6-hydroxymethyldihydropteridine diphosphokinase [Salinibacterium sp. SWN1162]|uniref:2-amino-4-hydroxy-6- hydroxymethyldihydropteridine diphosphokinase n=1 Tax=Salinibacterium sp. SWN1162 TaxID=2792053 RepID=UPI0018CC7D27|nr:2-amino-4-hydroxy-6-hydroxymethyldihydropteridine diphosphokinase [Salinibacterium sp. SWN1162]MBH0008327.1 2-amino-4-hydroxy-6-hydroxymethyldihydropteridine diphosphokinase [Salinibacterium sp. SWN1162]